MTADEVKSWRKAERDRLIAAREGLDAATLGLFRQRIDAHLWRSFPGLTAARLAFCWPIRGEYDARPLTRAKSRNLRRARKACPDNADANEIFFGQLTPLLSEMMNQVWDVHRSYRAIASVVYLPPAGFEPTTLRL